MAIANSEIRNVKPTHPGEMLREDFMPDYGLTAAGLAGALGVSHQTINEILRGAQSNFAVDGVDAVGTFREFTRFLAECTAGG